jgi:hypothetical protein
MLAYAAGEGGGSRSVKGEHTYSSLYHWLIEDNTADSDWRVLL